MSPTPELPEQWTVGCGTLNGQKVCRVDDVRAFGAACAAAEREQVQALLWQALAALVYHRDQTRPIVNTEHAIEAIRAAIAEGERT